MSKTFTLLFCIVSFLVSCRGVRTLPHNYAAPQEKVRSQMLAIFMDGTGDIPHKKTWKNSHVKNTHSLAFANINSLYIEGVGAGNRLRHAAKAITTNERILRAYRFLSENYKPGDSICLFGFSRGANQCRILSSFIYTIGIINMEKIKQDEDKQQLLFDLYDLYSATTGTSEKKIKLADHINRWNLQHPEHQVLYDTSGATMIEVLALWDTVEALTVGDRLEITTPLPQHLNQLYNVKKLYHALSLDDNRAFNYTPILATHTDVALHPGQDINSIVEEVWFNGSHKDVGGGVWNRKKNQLSGISLKWMLSKVKPYHIFRDTTIEIKLLGKVNDMRGNPLLRLLSPGDTLRGINKYWEAMNTGWNKHRIKVHYSVINRLDSGVVQSFKLKKGNKERSDWYDWEPFNKCFTKITTHGKTRIIFRKEDCPCIEMAFD